MSRSRALFTAVLALTIAGTACGAAEPAPPPAPDTTTAAPAPRAAPPTSTPAGAPIRLRVLLTDDDGWDAGGITATRKALEAAGADVLLVAPESNQSGTGARTDGVTEMEPKGEATFAVAGKPVDAVRAGLAYLQENGGPPDLVVSGANLGHNSGTGIGESGTVGAAVTAGRAGVPAIAASVHRASSEDDCEAAASYVARLVTALAGQRPVLPPGLVVNVNHPTGERASSVEFRDRLVVDIDGEQMDVQGDGPSDDVDALDDGVATVTELDVDGRSTSPPSVLDRLRGVGP